MDLKSFYKKIDVDSIKTKLPPMPQIKLPKIKSRKIFKSSREDVSSPTPKHLQVPPAGTPAIPPATFVNHTPTRISTVSSLMNIDEDIGGCYGSNSHSYSNNYNQGYSSVGGGFCRENTYRSADSMVEDESPPLRRRTIAELNKMENGGSPSAGETTTKKSFSEKCMKHYKDLSTFKIKHIFARKTLVRRTEIEVDHYAQRYAEDRIQEEREEMELDNLSEMDYQFDIKLARRRMSCNSTSISPPDSLASGVPSPVRSELGRLQRFSPQQEAAAPPPLARRKNASQVNDATQSKIANRLNSRRGGISKESTDDDEDICVDARPNRSALWSIKENRTPVEASQTTNKGSGVQIHSTRKAIGKLKNFMSREESVDSGDGGAETTKATATTASSSMWKLKKHRSGKAVTSQQSLDEASGGEERKNFASSAWKLKSLSRRHANEEEPTTTTATTSGGDGRLAAIKEGIKRFKPNIQTKRNRQSSMEGGSDEDQHNEAAAAKSSNTTSAIGARLRRFKSRDASIEEVDDAQATVANDEGGAPKSDFTTKLHNWKKSFKTKTEPTAFTGDEESPEKRSGTLIKKLKYIRTRRNPSVDDVNADESGGVGASTSTAAAPAAELSRKSFKLETKLENAREKAFKKVNAQMQRMKFFHKSQEDKEGEEEEEEEEKRGASGAKGRARSRAGHGIRGNYEIDPEQDDNYAEELVAQQLPQFPKKTRAIWTTNKIISESLESDDMPELPRVLIHQDNSDCFESTLIIAVTRPAPPAPTPIITEMLPKTNAEWIPNKHIISGFLEMTPPPQVKLHQQISSTSKGHLRKRSMDSNDDSDSWIPDNFRNKQCSSSVAALHSSSTAGLNIIDENAAAPWKVHTMFSADKLYKTKSVDIFAANSELGRSHEVFADFDDELKNVPVMRIIANSAESFEKEFDESTDEDENENDDNASRVTRIMVPALPSSSLEESIDSTEACHGSPTLKQQPVLDVKCEVPKKQRIGNSRESLDANFDSNDDDDEEDEENDDDVDDRPPSAAPSPPPTFSPPPPPLPVRKPPTAPIAVVPPKIPERNESMVRLAKPLVKQSSLRRPYNEEMQPSDVGKVNKLISRFEQPPEAASSRRRRMRAADDYDFDDDEDDDDEDDDDDDDDEDNNDDDMSEDDSNDDENASDKYYNNNNVTSIKDEQTTPTLRNYKSPSTETLQGNTNNAVPKKRIAPIPVPTVVPRHQAPVVPKIITTTTANVHHANNNNKYDDEDDDNNNKSPSFQNNTKDEISIPILIPLAALDLDSNSSRSEPSSEYGSPLGYPASLRGSACTTPTPGNNTTAGHSRHLHHGITRRLSNRSSLRDDDTFYSFESDEESNFYSFGETSSSGGRQVVIEI